MQDTLNNLETYGYIALFVYSLGGGFVGIVTAGVFSATSKMDLSLSVMIASIANILGSTLLAYLGRFQKQELAVYLQKHRRKLALMHLWLRHYGVWLIFVNKYLYGFRALLPLVVGLSKYPFAKFALWNALACVIWAIIMGLSGFWASNLAIELFERLKAYPYALPVGFLITLGVVWILMRWKSKKVY